MNLHVVSWPSLVKNLTGSSRIFEDLQRPAKDPQRQRSSKDPYRIFEDPRKIFKDPVSARS